MVEKTAAFRQRRAADTRRWRERLDRGAPVYPVEVDGQLFDLMERFGGLKDSKTGDRRAIATAPWQVAAPRAGGVAAGRNCFPALGALLINAGIGRMSARTANRTCRDGGNDVTHSGSSGRIRGSEVTEYLAELRGSLRLDVCCPDHLAPLFGFVGDELAEVGRRA